MRLAVRRNRIWNESYLVYRYLWQNLELACDAARGRVNSAEPTLLDVGCGHKPYADLFPGWRHIGINPVSEDASPDVVGDAMKLPFASASIDVVLCTQVLEHVPRPWDLLIECERVLKPGGSLVLSAPFYWPLHEEPYDFYRYTRHGLTSLHQQAGLTIDWLRADGGDFARLMLSLLQSLPRLLALPMRIPFNLAGVAFDRSAERAVLPLNYTVLSRKTS